MRGNDGHFIWVLIFHNQYYRAYAGWHGLEHYLEQGREPGGEKALLLQFCCCSPCRMIDRYNFAECR